MIRSNVKINLAKKANDLETDGKTQLLSHQISLRAIQNLLAYQSM